MTLSGKTALVTGGSRGIGRAICIELARRGANVVVGYSGSREQAEATAALCGNAIIAGGDVSRMADCEAIFAACEAAFDQPDILVNNAGITRDGLLMRMSEDDFDRVLEVNLRGAFNCTKLACRPMVRKRAGRMVNIASVVGLSGNAGQANYCASKAGLIGLTKATALELAGRGITVNAVAPGFIETDMTAALTEDARKALLGQIPAGRFGTAEDVAACVAFLCSDAANYITGQVISVNGGMYT